MNETVNVNKKKYYVKLQNLNSQVAENNVLFHIDRIEINPAPKKVHKNTTKK